MKNETNKPNNDIIAHFLQTVEDNMDHEEKKHCMYPDIWCVDCDEYQTCNGKKIK